MHAIVELQRADAAYLPRGRVSESSAPGLAQTADTNPAPREKDRRLKLSTLPAVHTEKSQRVQAAHDRVLADDGTLPQVGPVATDQLSQDDLSLLVRRQADLRARKSQLSNWLNSHLANPQSPYNEASVSWAELNLQKADLESELRSLSAALHTIDQNSLEDAEESSRLAQENKELEARIQELSMSGRMSPNR